MNGIIKKFMVGLPLDAEVNEWCEFLSCYKEHIECVYFSLPLGRRFHSRLHIALQFERTDAESHFLSLIKAVQDLDIPLETVLNTEGLSEADIFSAENYLKEKEISISSVTILGCYYDYVKEAFGDIDINYSYNNFLNSSDEIDCSYSAVMIGRYNIRNTELFREISEKGIRPVLLLNNGCSHTCGWCHSIGHCKEAFSDAVSKEHPEKLYALQSIMPFELHEKLLDVSSVYCYKINNRNSPLKYLKDCIDSYLYNINFLENEPERYSLWAKLGWFEPYYSSFDESRIRAEKSEIYFREYVLKKQYKGDKMKTYEVTLNLTDEYTVFDCDNNALLSKVLCEINKFSGNMKYHVTSVRLGAETCASLYKFITSERLIKKAKYFSDKGFSVSLVFPVIDESVADKCENILRICSESGVFHSVTVNDFGMLYIAKKLGMKTVFGRMFDKRLRDPRISSDEFLEGKAEEAGIFSESYLSLFRRENITCAEAECIETGIGEIPEEINDLYLHYPYRYITSGRICEFSGIGEENSNKFRISHCKMQCMKYIAKTTSQPLRTAVYKHCNSLTERIIPDKRIIREFSCDKVKIIYTPEYMGEWI